MFILRFLEWLKGTSFSAIMIGSTWTEPIIETIHVLTLTVFLGFAILLDLRLIGLGMLHRRPSQMLKQLNPWLGGSFAVMIVTGILLFVADPVVFYTSIFFKMKMIMLILAGVNVLIFNLTVRNTVGEWDEHSKPHRRARIAAIVSLILWIAIVAAGRAIAYSIPPPL
jgi:hypothetical protein